MPTPKKTTPAPAPAQPTARSYKDRKAKLTQAGQSTRYFDMSLHVQELLRNAARERRIPQIAMLEHMIKAFCEPEKMRKNDVF